MTHSLHREGSLDSLKRDYVLFTFPARGYNYKGSAPKVRHLAELGYQSGPVNMLNSKDRRNMYSGITPEEIIDGITVDGTRIYFVFDDLEKVKEVLKKYKEADEGISIVVSGLTDQIREITEAVGITPHTINLSLGIHGRTDRLPPADFREFTTMCGHGVVSPHRVKDILRRVKTGKVTEWEGSLILAEPCVCGFYNPRRSVELLRGKAPLYTVDRW
jgi:hypothetical protein